MASYGPSCECATQFEHIHLECAGSYPIHSPGHQSVSEDVLRSIPIRTLLTGDFAKWFEEGRLYPVCGSPYQLAHLAKREKKYSELFCALYAARKDSNIHVFLAYMDRFVASTQRVLPLKQAAIPEEFSIPGEVSLVFCILGNLSRKGEFMLFFNMPLTNHIIARMKGIKDALEIAALPPRANSEAIALGEEEEEAIVELLENIDQYERENEEHRKEITSHTSMSESTADNELDRKDSGIVPDIKGTINSTCQSNVGIRKDSAVADMSPEKEKVQNEQSPRDRKESGAGPSKLG